MGRGATLAAGFESFACRFDAPLSKEQIAKMKHFRTIGVALLAVFGLVAVVASASQAAETAPYFTIGGTRLVAGKTHNIDARVQPGAGHEFTLTNALGSAKITCKALGTEKGVLLGSNAGEPGKDNEITVFSQCAVEIPEKCELVNEAGEPTTVIKTEPLKSDQVENVENSKGGKKLYEEFFPANAANGFVTIHQKGTGTGCIEEVKVSGQVVGEVLLDNANAGNVELGQTPIQATSSLLRFPNPPITQVWLITNGVGKLQHTAQTAFGGTSIQLGTSLVLLANTKFEPEPNSLWSALP